MLDKAQLLHYSYANHMATIKERLLPKDICLNLAALGVVFGVGFGTGYIIREGDVINLDANLTFPGISPEQLPEATEYIKQNSKPEYPAMEVFYIPTPQPPEIQEKLSYYKDLQSRIKMKEEFTISRQNEIILPAVELAILMTLGLGFVVTRSGEIFKQALS